MAGRRPDGGNFFGGIARRLPPLGLIERTPHPGCHSEPLAFCEPPDLGKLTIWQQHLQSFTHDMSIV